MYKSVQTLIIEERMLFKAQDDNNNDKNTVLVMKDCCIVEYILCSIFPSVYLRPGIY